MSRRPGLILVALFVSSSLTAQEGEPVTAEQALESAKRAYSPPDLRPTRECPAPALVGEIVVCAQPEPAGKYRVPSSADLDPTGLGARDGKPHAPDQITNYPGPVVANGCFIPPCPPPMPVLIDLKAIPEAPPGSDADLIARGERPQ